MHKKKQAVFTTLGLVLCISWVMLQGAPLAADVHAVKAETEQTCRVLSEDVFSRYQGLKSFLASLEL